LPLLLQGKTYAPGDVKWELADAIREFNNYVSNDPRVDVVAMPFRDGVSIITRRCRSFLVYDPLCLRRP
jgi:predicted O-methyltransferase YrrM